MEGTLDFAEKVGWMAKSDRQATKDAHLEEQLAHADSHQNEGGGGSDHHHGNNHGGSHGSHYRDGGWN